MENVATHTGPQVIETLPPLDELRPQVPISPATGQPRRSKWMVVAMSFLYASAVVAAVSLAKGWWDAIHMHTFPHAVKIIEWWQPRPGGWRSIVAVVLMFALGGLMTAAPAIAGFNAWNGYRWSRPAAIVATVVALGAFAMNSWALPALPLAAIGAALLWLPAVSRYFRHWDEFRAGSVIVPRRTPDHVVYGALPRFR
ncbi:hypothetical protein [Luteococcus sanguinis]|uniref:Transmembrane protein n=1 Tax=Luteococcus sanguinis TaxID=174038 RepID=A0ABW1X6N9_9ACTN